MMSGTQCFSCHGTGKITCGSCHGRKHTSRFSSISTGGMDISPCGACAGTGKQRCPACGGRRTGPPGTSQGAGFAPELVAGMNAAPGNVLPIVSLVLGVASWLGVSLLASVPAIITGHMARSDPDQDGRGLAMVGLLLGYANILVSVVVLLFLISLIV